MALKQSLLPKLDSRLDNVCPEQAKVVQHWYEDWMKGGTPLDGGITPLFDEKLLRSLLQKGNVRSGFISE